MDLTPVLEAIIGLATAIVTAVVIPYIRSRTSASQQTEIIAWVKIAVAAAEQIYNGNGQGKAKKEYVQVWLQAHGITVDADKLDAMIESAVYQLKKEASA